ncbi:hypothetical protein N7470_006780 [Penicillium chermesinum]|nr:hypothetical protein N7470_006780 [Penicillium chermesinum]
MAPRRRHIGASRRQRRDEEGEDEGPPAAEVEDDSLSEGSAESHQDDEDADVEASETEDEVTAGPDKLNGKKLNGREQRYISPSPDKPGLKATASDTEAMLNGLTISNDTEEDSLGQINDNQEPPTSRTPSAPPTESKREPLATKKKRENDKYVKEREQNPAFVPTKGSFFLHDNRAAETGSNGRSSNSNKSKSRPFGLIVDGNARRPMLAGGLWRHDLHDTVAGDDPPVSKQASSLGAPPPSTAVPTAPRSSPPNRSFSSTTLVGNFPKISIPAFLSIALPCAGINRCGYLSRTIFLATFSHQLRDPSFLFLVRYDQISRATAAEAVGVDSTPQRRQSYYPGSYTPSVVSRRSSFGVAPSQDGYPSPAGSVYSRPVQPMPPMFPLEPNKPVVRLPPHPRPPMGMPPPGMPMMPAGPGPVPPSLPLPFPAYREGRPAQTMHQPRPKKPVSVADIESPATYALNQSRPPPEQPFHHQVPVATNGPGPGPDGTAHDPTGQPSATPLSQIPERAIHAVPFNPYGYQQPGYYGHYPPGPIYYPGSGAEYPAYNGPMGPGASVPNFPSGQQPMPYMVPPSSGEQSAQGTVAHELNGTVYFHPNPSANYGAPHGQGPGGVVGMGGMITPPGATYRYPQPPGGGAVFYGQP